MLFRRIKLILSAFLLTLMYSFVLAFGMSVAHTLSIVPEQPVLSTHTQAQFTTRFDKKYDDTRTYAWYIDGVPLEGVETASLTLDREQYTELFPDESHRDGEKVVTVKTHVLDQSFSDTARLYVEYTDASCGDGIVQYEQGEECDDGNRDDTDGCSASCLCEGMCVSLLLQK